MPPSRVLILGGTADAREIAEALAAAGHATISSLAGVTTQPLRPAGALRVGGFGGSNGLARYLAAEHINLVIDGTHPFAAQISRQAMEACVCCDVPLFRFERAPWATQEGDTWIPVPSVGAAAEVLPAGARVLLTIGRRDMAVFFGRPDISGIARMIEPPPASPPPHWRVVCERPPFSEASEVALLDEGAITHVVSKNAGGSSTEAKLTAARKRGIPVVMIARPEKPAVPVFTSRDALLAAVGRVLSP